MDTNEPTLSTGAAESGSPCVGVDYAIGPDRTGVIVMPPRHSKTMAMAAMRAAVAPEVGAAPAARRRGSPYLDLATKHGTAAALKAEAPQVRGQRQLEGVCPGEPFCSCWASAIALPRDTKRAARKVRMATKRRRGW